MWKKVEIEVDSDLVQEAISRYRLAHAREAVHLAPRTLLGEVQ
jgi:Arc/MetJ family transcription regulator